MGYDGQGSQRWIRDHAGMVSFTQLDGLGRVIATIQNYENGVVDPSDGSDRDLIQQTMYDAAGRVLRQIASGGQVTQFAYDNPAVSYTHLDVYKRQGLCLWAL